MIEVVYLIIGLAAGGAAVWFFASSRFHAHYSRQMANMQSEHLSSVAECEGRAKGAEAVVNELRQQVQQRETDINQIRLELNNERQIKADVMARFDESQKSLQKQKELLEVMENRIGETFKALSLDALAKNSDEFKKYADEFIKLAEEKLKSQAVEGKKELDGKKELIDQNVQVIAKTLSEMQQKLVEVEKGSVKISTLVEHHADITSKLKDTTEHLKHALASSKKRGEWGERMAEDIIRLIGMVEGINYIKQKTLEGSSGRPDYTFFLPNNLKINMDVKFPIENYQYYLDAHAEHDKKRYKDELLKNTKLMIKQVTTRDYINPTDNTVDYVIVFIPNEQVYSFINEADMTIMDEALRQKVILCSPFTLYAVLAVIRQAVENFNLEKTASEILKLLAEFSKQWNTYKEKFRIMGDRLEAAKKEYDMLITTRTNMLERPLKKIDDLRKQKSIEFNGEINLDEEILL